MNFETLSKAVRTKFNEMGTELFVTDVDKTELWEMYLSSFPEGSNPIYITNTEHDCNCCRQFIKTVGATVSISASGELTSVWDIDLPLEPEYQAVADALSAHVKSKRIINKFYHYEPVVSRAKTAAQLTDGTVISWNHFSASVPTKLQVSNDKLGKLLSTTRSNGEVLLRSLKELTEDSAATVLELIAQNSLYRGQEHVPTLDLFLKCKRHFDALDTESKKEAYCWKLSSELGGTSKFRNTVIGSLLQDLSEGKDLESSVKSFEAKVAPANYKRPKSLVTKAMIEKSLEAVKDLGYESALARRYATTEDITINNVLFADRSTKPVMKDSLSVFDELVAEVPTKPKNFDKVEEISINEFIEKVVPTAESIEAYVENSHSSNMMSLIAPVDPEASHMFKWNNNFCWSYTGEVADSDLRANVQKLGGRVDGVLRFSHTWNYDGNNQSLMDLHVFLPTSGYVARSNEGCHEHYPNSNRVGWNNRRHTGTMGVQDVDFVNPPMKNVPVENITFPDVATMPEGVYTLRIHNWKLRSGTTSGFRAEVEFAGQVFEYEYTKPLDHHEWVTVAEVTLKNGVFSIDHKIPASSSSKDLWGIKTESFTKVRMIMNSPNHWDGNETGNKHLFFILDECAKQGDARGFYNEFLDERLTEHRKTFEMVGAKMRATEDPNQLSGLGFSTTQRNHVIVKVTGSFTRMLKVTF